MSVKTTCDLCGVEVCRREFWTIDVSPPHWPDVKAIIFDVCSECMGHRPHDNRWIADIVGRMWDLLSGKRTR